MLHVLDEFYPVPDLVQCLCDCIVRYVSCALNPMLDIYDIIQTVLFIPNPSVYVSE